MTCRFRDICFLIASLVTGWFVLLDYRDRQQKANQLDPVAFYDEIPLGTSRQELELRFGLPPGDYRMNKAIIHGDGRFVGLIEIPPPQRISWSFDTCVFDFELDEDGVIVGKRLRRPFEYRPPTFFEHVCTSMRQRVRSWMSGGAAQ